MNKQDNSIKHLIDSMEQSKSKYSNRLRPNDIRIWKSEKRREIGRRASGDAPAEAGGKELLLL